MAVSFIKGLPVILLGGSLLGCSGMAWASCGAATCPLDTTSHESREPGWVRVGYQWEYIDQDAHRLGHHKAGFGEVRGHHDEQ